MSSTACLTDRIDRVFPLLARQMTAAGKGALLACTYNKDFVKKTSWSKGNTYASKLLEDEGRMFSALIFGETVGGGDGTKITALGNYWAGDSDNVSY